MYSCSTRKFSKPKGMGLVEILVAIGISIITLTGAVVFSTTLARRAQENFVEVSALQLQSLFVEELRLMELGLKSDVQNNPNASSAYSAPNTFLGSEWQSFCSNSSLAYFKMTLPDMATSQSTPFRISLTDASTNGAQKPVPAEGGVQYYFADPFIGTGIQRFGAFNTSGSGGIKVMTSMKKTVVSSSSNPLNNIITIKTITTYNMFGKDYFTKPQEVKMIYSLVCPG